MDKEPVISLTSYYGAAIPRAFGTGLDWALNQGLLLTILLGLGAVICAAIYAVIRALRRSHSWSDAMSSVWHAIVDFLIAGVGAVVVVLLGLFVWFFVNDAPTQLSDAQKRIEQLNKRVASLSPPPAVPPPRPFYSDKQKNEIADQMQRLVVILDNSSVALSKDLESIADLSPTRMQNLSRNLHMQAWYAHKSAPSDSDVIEATSPKIIQAEQSIGSIQRQFEQIDETLFGNGGVMVSLPFFLGPMSDILKKNQFKGARLLFDKSLQRCMERLKDAKQFSVKYADLQLFNVLLDHFHCTEELSKARDNLREWINNTKNHAEAARNAL